MFQIQQFGIQILQSPVTFSAFGLTLNNSILSMVSIKFSRISDCRYINDFNIKFFFKIYAVKKIQCLFYVFINCIEIIFIILFRTYYRCFIFIFFLFIDFENCNNLHGHHGTSGQFARIEQ